MTDTDTKILDMLFNNGVIDKAKYQAVLHHHKTQGDAIEDAIIDSGAGGKRFIFNPECPDRLLSNCRV